MKVRHQVSDDAMRAALNNQEYRALVWSVFRRYAGQIHRDELEDGIPYVIYRTLGSHEEGRGQKFTTSLVKFARWYASNRLDDKRLRAKRFEQAVEAYRDSCEVVAPDRLLEVRDELNDVLRDVPEGYREVLLDYYVGGHTVESLAQKYGCPRDFVERRLGNAVHVARQLAQARYDEVESEAEEDEESEEW